MEPRFTDTCDKTYSSRSPERIAIDFCTLKPHELQTPRYSVRWALNLSRLSLRNKKITRYNGQLGTNAVVAIPYVKERTCLSRKNLKGR